MINKCNNHLDFFFHPYPDLDGDPDPTLSVMLSRLLKVKMGPQFGHSMGLRHFMLL